MMRSHARKRRLSRALSAAAARRRAAGGAGAAARAPTTTTKRPLDTKIIRQHPQAARPAHRTTTGDRISRALAAGGAAEPRPAAAGDAATRSPRIRLAGRSRRQARQSEAKAASAKAHDECRTRRRDARCGRTNSSNGRSPHQADDRRRRSPAAQAPARSDVAVRTRLQGRLVQQARLAATKPRKTHLHRRAAAHRLTEPPAGYRTPRPASPMASAENGRRARSRSDDHDTQPRRATSRRSATGRRICAVRPCVCQRCGANAGLGAATTRQPCRGRRKCRHHQSLLLSRALCFAVAALWRRTAASAGCRRATRRRPFHARQRP